MPATLCQPFVNLAFEKGIIANGLILWHGNGTVNSSLSGNRKIMC